MAKIKHTSAYDEVDYVVTTTKKKKIMPLTSQEEAFNEELINFGNCGYLRLEKHPHILAKSYEFLDRYGAHFSISRAFVKAPYLEELEALISKFFDNHPVIVYTSKSIAHQSVLGDIINSDDLIILDQQLHYSVQYPYQYIK